MSAPPCKGVLFDMDGLLLDTERLALAGFEQAAQDLDLPDIIPLGRSLIGLRSDAVEARLRATLPGHVSFETFDDIWPSRFRAALARGIPLKPGVTALLTHLAETGLPCAIATSTRTERAREHLEQAGIAQHFHSVTGGDQVAQGKPAPDIYHMAAASLGLTAPDCIAFEDSDPGATAAIASGARTVQVPDTNPPGSQMHEKGHLIAATLLDGAYRVGLYPASH